MSLYGMISYVYARPFSVEAGIKYLVLAAVSAAFLLFGMALIYMAAGTMEFERMAAIATAGKLNHELLLAGIALIITGFGFKLALVPFHFWTPDVYQKGQCLLYCCGISTRRALVPTTQWRQSSLSSRSHRCLPETSLPCCKVM